MPRATVASRELKNKDTGLDLYVPTFREEKGRLSSTVFYHVVVVTNLQFFKTPSHKENDVVQCSCERKWSEFEDLRVKLSEAFAGTILPILDKKSFIVNDQVIKERRNTVEAFLKFIASTPRLAVSSSLLQFLGVDAIRANKAKQSDISDTKKTSEPTSQNEDNEGAAPDKDSDLDVFGKVDDAGQDGINLFEADENDDSQLFSGANLDSQTDSFSMFEAPDLKPDIDEDDEKNFNFIPDSIITKKEKINNLFEAEDDGHEELFRVEDDLDHLMLVDVKGRLPQQQGEESLKTKPQPATKPRISSKPSVPVKPNRPDVASKPAIPARKPGTAVGQVNKSSQDASASSSSAVGVDTMQQDDLMAYLQENLNADTEEVDLFS